MSNEHTSDPGESMVFGEVVVAIAAALVFLALMVALVAYRFKIAASQHLYVKWEDISFSDPPMVIGTGPMGDVRKGEYRSMHVAVKVRTHKVCCKLLASPIPRCARGPAQKSSPLLTLIQHSALVLQPDVHSVASDVPLKSEPCVAMRCE